MEDDIKYRISQVRKSANLTQDLFAKKIKLSKNFVWMLEKGERIPSDRTISDICREFNVNEEWLRYGTGSMPKVTDDAVAECAADLLTEDTPFYNLITGIMIKYRELDLNSREVVDNCIEKIINTLKKED